MIKIMKKNKKITKKDIIYLSIIALLVVSTVVLSVLLVVANYKQQREVFERFIQMHAKDIRIVHLKDFTLLNDWLEERPLFEGELDVEYVIEVLQKYKVNADFIVENAQSVEKYKEIKQRLEKILKGV